MCDKIVSDVCLMNTMLGRKAVLGVEGEAIWDRDTVCVCVYVCVRNSIISHTFPVLSAVTTLLSVSC